MNGFDRCDFLLGQGHSVVIVVPGHLPRAETYTVSVSDSDIKFKAGHDCVAEMSYQGGEVYNRIANNVQVGLVAYEEGQPFPDHITHMAYVEVRRAH